MQHDDTIDGDLPPDSGGEPSETSEAPAARRRLGGRVLGVMTALVIGTTVVVATQGHAASPPSKSRTSVLTSVSRTDRFIPGKGLGCSAVTQGVE